MASNTWELEGSLGKREYLKTGLTKAGKPYLIDSVSIYGGKDKKTGKAIYERVNFFVPPDDHEVFKNFPDGQKIRLKGKPVANGYINKDGDLVTNLNMQVAWEDYYELIDSPGQEAFGFDEVNDSEPF